MLRLLHTADWHVGKRFPSFSDGAQKTLMRARLEVVGRILDVAVRHRVSAILAAGDLFDEPNPAADFWEALARLFQDHPGPHVPLFLVPGNHDALLQDSVWWPSHPFRGRLPPWVHVVDRDDFQHELAPGVTLFARPCRSKAGQDDLALLLPAREPGDESIRIGCVHGSTFDVPGYQMNFPIARDAGVRRGFDYIAIGDTHAFRDASADLPTPTVYPSAPEPTAFDEQDVGNVAIVSLFRHGTRPRIHRERVAFWRWLHVTCTSLRELRDVLLIPDLDRHVLRLDLDLVVTLAEEAEVERILRDLQGTEATVPRAGIVRLDRSRLRRLAGSAGLFEGLPPVLADTVARLDQLADDAVDDAERDRANRALTLLYRLVQTHLAAR